MSRFRLSHQAQRDVRGIWAHIAADNVPAADGLIDKFYEMFRPLATHSLMGQARPDLGLDLRVISDGNYVVVFHPLRDGVRIARVLHGARDIDALFDGG